LNVSLPPLAFVLVGYTKTMSELLACRIIAVMVDLSAHVRRRSLNECVWLSRSWPLVSVPTHSGQVYVGPHHFSRRLLPFAHPRPIDGFKNRFLDIVLKLSLQIDFQGRFH
jgi:hypothetical protein